jgi:predicted signal transduction protein with EAL and GGDEF domain
LRKVLAIEVSSSELREIDFLVILSIAVFAYLATGWIVVGNFFDIQLVRASFFVAVALATFGVRRERKQRLAAEDRAHLLSIRDPLTQLPNRQQFETQVSNALKIGTRPIIILIGLDKFHNVDDLYGHLGSDAALCQVAARSWQYPERAYCAGC